MKKQSAYRPFIQLKHTILTFSKLFAHLLLCCILSEELYSSTVVLIETVIMPEPQARALSVLKSILLSQGQFIYHDNAIYISNYYFYFIEGNKTF